MNDDSDFSLDVPSPLAMAREECALLHSELRDVWAELRRSRRNTAKLVQMNALLMADLEKLRLENKKVMWALAERPHLK
ncbi:hypothetical protein [Pseudomonas sp. PSKL.D1]|uniref:hypothetical protein n=1 Tax=Pseudomonas sp. PSKL.D1 TaxID=3029060 RepID=UPI0023817BB2|nr:hypothetical protein [Pseudomonas sp. PSKL.D1]WDY60480.1 hypothetical protein PVV54_12880 [Pseudomonas sp. PSKL.D1]